MQVIAGPDNGSIAWPPIAVLLVFRLVEHGEAASGGGEAIRSSVPFLKSPGRAQALTPVLRTQKSFTKVSTFPRSGVIIEDTLLIF
jgi:hypothetical protein